MNRDDIIRIAKKADDLTDAELGSEWNPDRENLRDIHFAALVAAEKEQQMIRDGWRKCAEGQRTTQFCGLLDAAVKAEREACAKLCEKEQFEMTQDVSGKNGLQHFDAGCRSCAEMIRRRGDV